MPVRGFAFLIFAVLAVPAQARVFNYKDSGLAAYLRGTGGFSKVNQEPFAHSSGGADIEEGSHLNYGGEIGFLFGLSANLHMRVGAEVIQARPVSQAKGTNSSDAELFSLDSSVFVFNPNVTFEYVYSGAGNLRFFSAVGAGLADITVENRYTMTATGTSAFGGVQDFNEKMSAQTTSGHFLIGLETLFLDNVTFTADVGYRYMPVKELKYKGDTNNIVSPGGVTKGSTVYNEDGSKRTMDLGGLFAGIAFRFYLNFL